VPVQYRGVREDAPRGLLQGLGNVARHIPGPFVELGVVLNYQEGVVILHEGGPQLGRKAKALPTFSSTMSSRSSWLRMPERMPVIKRILNCCRWGLPFRARSISSGAMRTLNDGEQGDGGQELDFYL